jgi:hypothetical protein
VKHWQPDSDVTKLRPSRRRGKRALAPAEAAPWDHVDSYALPRPAKRHADRSAAIAGLAVVAAGCAAVCVMLYQLLGPSDNFAP